jgi:hypothetical protein
MPRGGKRPGAGRKKKDRSEQDLFEDAESYLLAVVQGRTSPDAVRVAAAKTLIAYQKARQRAPVKSKTPSQLHQHALSSVQKSANEAFEKKANQIRAKFKKENPK